MSHAHSFEIRVDKSSPSGRAQADALYELAERLACLTKDPETGIVVRKFARADADTELGKALKGLVPEYDALVEAHIKAHVHDPVEPLKDPVFLGLMIQRFLPGADLAFRAKARFANLAEDMSAGRRPRA